MPEVGWGRIWRIKFQLVPALRVSPSGTSLRSVSLCFKLFHVVINLYTCLRQQAGWILGVVLCCGSVRDN